MLDKAAGMEPCHSSDVFEGGLFNRAVIMNCLYGELLSARASVGLLVLRVVMGAAFMFHGYSKIQNPFGWMGSESHVPGIFQALAALSEFGGGLALILGLLTPLAALGIACTMAAAVFMVHVPKGDPFVGKGGSYELPLVYFAASVMFMLIGAGKLSLDKLIFGRNREITVDRKIETPMSASMR